MTETSYRKALDDLRNERSELMAKRKDIDHRLTRIDAAIANLAVVIDDEPFEGGLAEACRMVLMRNTGRPGLVATEVRDGLKEIGYDTNKHSNIMASVHSVLKRMAESPEVSAIVRSDGGVSYSWTGQLPAKATTTARELVGRHPFQTPKMFSDADLKGISSSLKQLQESVNATRTPELLEQYEAAAKSVEKLIAKLGLDVPKFK